MSEREDSDEECAAGLTVHNEGMNSENVNLAPPEPREESLTEGNAGPSSRSAPSYFYSRPAEHYVSPTSFAVGNPNRVGAYDFPMSFTDGNFAPSSVASLPPVDTSAWCPSHEPQSANDQFRFLVPEMGINVRGPNPSVYSLPSLMSGLSLRPETPSTPSDCAMAAEEKKVEETSELCAALNSASIDTSEPFNPCVAGKMKEGVTTATSLTAIDDYPKSCDAAGSEDKSDAAEDGGHEDDGDENVVVLRESFPENTGTSRELTGSSASAMNLRSMEADTGDIDSVGCTLPEQNPKARGFEQHCCGDPGKVKSDNCNPLHCDTSPGSRSSAQLDAESLDTFGTNLLDPLDSTHQNAAAGGEAEPPDTGQAAEDDDDLQWVSCKICWLRRWKFVFIPCGHGCCKPCYRRLRNMLCPFCRKYIRQIVEVLLAYG